MKSTAALPSLLLAVGLAAGGCGGGADTTGSDPSSSSSPSSAAPAISKVEFTDQANVICAKGSAEIEAAAKALGDSPTQAEIEAFAAGTLLDNVQAQHDAIAALGAPEGDEDEVNAILDSLQTGIEALKADPSIITSADSDPFAEANDLASRYGLSDCA